MRKCVVMLLLLFPARVTLFAQNRAHIGVNGAALSMSSATENGITRGGSTAGGVLTSFRFWFTPQNGFELNYGHANDTQTMKNGALRTSLHTGIHEVSGLYVFRLKPAARFQPFFGLGAALLQFNPQKNSGLTPLPESQNKPGAVYALGFDYRLGNHFGTRVQFRGLVYAAPSFLTETFRSNTMHHMSEPTFGLVYRF